MNGVAGADWNVTLDCQELLEVVIVFEEDIEEPLGSDRRVTGGFE